MQHCNILALSCRSDSMQTGVSFQLLPNAVHTSSKQSIMLLFRAVYICLESLLVKNEKTCVSVLFRFASFGFCF